MAPRVEPADLFKPAPLPQAPLDDAQRLACLRLIRSDRVGPVTFRELINHYGGAAPALAALPELARRGGSRGSPRLFPREAAEAELEAAAKAGAIPLFTVEPGYPAMLARVEAPPPLLYVKGETRLLNGPTVAIVGSRNASAAGRRLTRDIVVALAGEGLVIASGLARGIDAAAHEAALARGTVAVLAGGIDHVYPPDNADLHKQIAVEGCLVTEQPPGFVPRGQDFPRRNRIIAGLSMGVLVVEAARRSGSLITARQAGEQGREVMAVPGHPLDPRAEGTNQLLKEGATLVTSAADVLAAIASQLLGDGGLQGQSAVRESGPIETNAPEETTLDDPARARVLEALGPAPINVDDLARATGLGIRRIKIALLELALAGRIEQHGAQLVSLKPR